MNVQYNDIFNVMYFPNFLFTFFIKMLPLCCSSWIPRDFLSHILAPTEGCVGEEHHWVWDIHAPHS
jgi:hypothetical protein